MIRGDEGSYRTDYEPNPTCERFHRNDAFVRGLMGPVGSGKSVACCVEAMLRAQRQQKTSLFRSKNRRMTRGVVIRNTYRELEDTTLATWFSVYPKPTGVANEPFTFKRQSMTYTMEFPDMHMEVLFRALDRPDDVSKLLSLELTWAWVNEAREVPFDVIRMLQARVGRYPGMSTGGPSWAGIWMDTNPPDSDSWWYRMFEEKRPDNWVLFRQPGARDPMAENLNNLRKHYYENLIQSNDEDWVRVYVDGQYGYLTDGKPVHPNFKHRTHVYDVEPPLYQRQTLLLGADFGLTPALVVLQQRPGGGWVAIDEVTTEDTGAGTFANTCVTKLNLEYPGMTYEGYGDPSGDNRSPTNESETVFTVLADEGLELAPSPDRSNDPVLRVEAVNKLLTTIALDGDPALMVSPKCTRLIKGLAGAYHYKRVQTHGEERWHEKPFKNPYSHVCEALQYALVGIGEGEMSLAPASSIRPNVHRSPRIGQMRVER